MKVPNEAKIIFREQSFGDIESYIDSYAKFLFSQGITSMTPIGIYTDKTPECLFIMLAAIKIGVPFLPLEISWPYKRICFMLHDSNIKYLVTSNKYMRKFNGYHTICIDNIMHNIEEFVSSNSKNEIMYILYTSGSTGNPKGVEVRRDGFYAFMNGVSERIEFVPNKRIACFTNISFDIFFLESIMALYKGLTVVLASDEESVNPRLMSSIIINNKVDMIQMTPSRMQLLMNYDKDLKCLSNISEILVGGEVFPNKLLLSLQQKTSAKIYNMYGPTESTIWVTISDLTRKNIIDIGTPIEGTKIYILDENLESVPEGTIGEICIAGKGLAKGYINNQALTNESFLTLSFDMNERIYRTGDFGKFENGVYIYIGRKDNQVKIRGHRIELEEIEFAMLQIEGINQAVVAQHEQEDGALIAFYTGELVIDKRKFKKELGKMLPSYMVPSNYVKLEKMSYTCSGKINRKKIIMYYNDMCSRQMVHGEEKESFTSQSERIEEKILSVIERYCDRNNEISLKSELSALGLDSITYITIIVTLEEEFGFQFDDEMLLYTAFTDVESLISYVRLKISSTI